MHGRSDPTFQNWPLFSQGFSPLVYEYHTDFVEFRAHRVAWMSKEGRQMFPSPHVYRNCNSPDVVNKGEYAPVTLRHRVNTPHLVLLLSLCRSLGLRNRQHRNINAVEVQSGSNCPCLLKHHKTRKTIQWQSWQTRSHKLGRLASAIALYLLQTSGPKLHLGNRLWLAKLIEKRGKKTIGWNVLAPEGRKFGSGSPPLCSALRSSPHPPPPTLCHPTCIFPFVPSSLLTRHLRPASPPTPLLLHNLTGAASPPTPPFWASSQSDKKAADALCFQPLGSPGVWLWSHKLRSETPARCSAGCLRRCDPFRWSWQPPLLRPDGRQKSQLCGRHSDKHGIRCKATK